MTLRHYDRATWIAIDMISDLPTSGETPGVARDENMDALIYCARNIAREQTAAVRDFDAKHYDAITGERIA